MGTMSMLISAVEHYNGTDVAMYKEGASGKTRWMLAPMGSVRQLRRPEVASQGVYFPHPLKSFGKIIGMYLLAGQRSDRPRWHLRGDPLVQGDRRADEVAHGARLHACARTVTTT